MPTISTIQTGSTVRQAKDAAKAQAAGHPPDKKVDLDALKHLPVSLREKVLEVEQIQSGVSDGFSSADSIPEGLNTGSTTKQIIDYFRSPSTITAEKKREDENRRRTEWENSWRYILDLPGSQGIDTVFDPEAGSLSIVYGRAKVGGRVSTVLTRDDFTDSSAPSEGGTGVSAYESDVTYYEKNFVGGIGRVVVSFNGNIIYSEIEPNIEDDSDLDEDDYESGHIIYLPNGYRVSKGALRSDQTGIKRYELSYTTGDAGTEFSINMPSTIEDGRNKFLVMQQALSYGEIDNVHHVLIDGANFHNREQRAKIHYSHNGSEALELGTSNGIPTTNTFTNVSYLTAIFAYDPDTNNYSDRPEITSYITGKKIYTIEENAGVYSLSDTQVYSNNPAFVLLDYLTNKNYGAGGFIKDSDIDLKSFYDASVICDTTVQENAEFIGHTFNYFENSYISGSDFMVALVNEEDDPSYTVDGGVDVDYYLNLNGRGSTQSRSGPWDVSSFPSNELTANSDLAISSVDWSVIPRLENGSHPITFSDITGNNATINVNPNFLNNQLRGNYSDGGYRVSDSQYRFVIEAKMFYDTDRYVKVRKNLDLLVNGDNLEYEHHPSYVYSVSRNLPLYECNIALNTSTSIKDNIETILGSMYGANLFWSEGKYKLSAHYPGTSEEQEGSLAAIISSEDIISANLRYTTPNSQDRINQATLQFSNEQKDFEQDTVTWPPSYGSVHRTYLDEDKQDLKGNYNFESIKDPYHALARAEQLVRTSRIKQMIELTVSRKYLHLELNDLIRINDTNGVLGFNEVFKIEDMNIKNDTFNITVKAEKFDYVNLAWNISDDIANPIEATELIGNRLIQPPSTIMYDSTSDNTALSSGRLTWETSSSDAQNRFNIYIREDD